MKLNDEEKALLEQWLEDPSFLNWARQSNDEDMSKWEHYFNSNPHHWDLAKVGRALELGISFIDVPKNDEESTLALTNLLRRLESDPVLEKPHTKTIRLRKFWLAAASVTLLLLVGGITYFQFFYHSKVLLTTGYGQQLETQLPDGSVVTLNANSNLKYNSRNPRKVWLEGEAFFEVEKKPDSRSTFQVLTPDLTVTVLGTSFNVNSRNDQTKVFLEEGKVNLEVDDLATGVIQMEPGDLIAYSKKQKRLKEKRNNVSALENSYWKEGTLIFNDTSLPLALYEIEDIYGIQFVLLNEALKREVISGGVPIRDLEVTLQTLSEVYGIRFRTEGRRYFISGKYE